MIANSAKTWHIYDMHSRYPFKKGSRVERGEKYAYSRYPHKKDTRVEKGEITKGVKCIEERPSLVGHKSKGVK